MQTSKEVNGKCPARNTTVQLSTLYTDPERHNLQRFRQIDRQTAVSCEEPSRPTAYCSSTICFMVFHGSAPAYLIDELCQVTDVEARQRLRSSSSSSLIVSRTRLSTVGDRAFPVAAAHVWSSLPDLVTSAPSVAVFRSRLKTHLFNISYPSPL